MYSNDKTWRKVQAFLPYESRLLPENLPDEVFLQAGNARIHIDHYPSEAPKATIILFHGVGGNGRLLSFIAVPLNRQGYEIICPDLPLFLFGLSAGGMLAYQVACEMDSINGVMATCLLDQRNSPVTKKTASNPLVAMAGKPFLKLLHRPLGAMKLPMKAVCNMRAIVNNQELAELLMSDKRSSGANVSIEFLYSMLNPLIKMEACKFDKCPVLLVHPQRDNWTDLSLSQLFFNELRCEKVLKLLDGAGHFPIEPEGLKQLEYYCVDFMSKFSR